MTQEERLIDALRPFAEMEFGGSAYEDAPEDKSILFNHATGKEVVMGDFNTARLLVQMFDDRNKQ